MPLHKVKNILYVEDEKAIQEELSSFLNLFCENLYIANNGQEALETYKNQAIDIIISDIKMPILDGIEMAKKIRKINEDQDIIFITAHNDVEYLTEAIDLQASAYLLKPVDLDKLEKKITDVTISLLWQDIEENKNKELETIIETSIDGIAILDLETNIQYANKAFSDMLEYSQEELQNLNSIQIGVPENIETSHMTLKQLLIDQVYENYEKTYISKSGKYIDVNMNLALMPDKTRILASIRDITELKEKRRLIKEYINIVDNNVLVSSTNLQGIIINVSEAFCQLSGYSKDELIGQSHNIIRHPNTSNKTFQELWSTISKGEIWKGELQNRKKDGSSYWVKSTITPNYDKYGKKTGYTALRHDISDKKTIEEISKLDPLTKIYNRRYFDEIFNNVLNSAKRDNKYFCFVLIDIDHFKQYNDTYGHQKGDDVLIHFANNLKAKMHRADDYAFRLGGEEFGIIFKADNIEHSITFVQAIRKSVEDLKIKHEKNSASNFVTASMGLIVVKPDSITQINESYKLADELLYQVKENGRNNISHKVI